MITYFESFMGIGGFSLGFPEAWKCVGYSEIFQPAIELITTKFPGIKNYGNIRKILPEQLPDFDVFTGGFPCPDFSIANRNRPGLNGSRGSLFFEILRIIRSKKPKCFILENVRGLLSDKQGKTFEIVLNELRQSGYHVRYVLLDAQFFGLAQQRKRVFIIGSLRAYPPPQIQHIGNGYKRNDNKSDAAGVTAQSIITRNNKQDFKIGTYLAYCLCTESRGTSQLWNTTHIARADTTGKRETAGVSRRLDKIRGHLIGNAVPPALVKEVVKSIIPILS